VRELANAIERALVVGKPPIIRAEDLPLRLSGETAPSAGDSLADVERVQIEAILHRTGWNITRAAEVLKIDRVTLYNKIKKYDLRK
jgi:DNA-binding NtrC family response regulator